MEHPTKNELYGIYLSHHPTVQELETYKAHSNYVSSFGSMLEVIELKLEATKAVPTVLGETMSVAQLFESRSPLWMKSYSVSELCHIMTMRNKIDDKVFARLLEQATDYKTLMRELTHVTA